MTRNNFMYMCSIHFKYFSLVIRKIKLRGKLVIVLKKDDDDDLLKNERGYIGN